MNDHDVDTELRSAVRSYADGVHPGDQLGAIRARTHGGAASGVRTAWWRGPWMLAGVAATAAAAVVVGAVVWVGADPAGTDTPVADDGQRVVTVYELGEVGKNLWLYPEQVMTEDTGNPAFDAVRTLLEHEPTQKGRGNLLAACPIGGKVEGVAADTSETTVRLSEFPPYGAVCEISRAGMRASAQQLVWTVRTATGANQPVRVDVEGQDDYPPAQANPAALSPVLIDSPTDGTTVSSPLRISGTSDTFEANVVWEVRQDGEVVEDGFTMGGTMGERGPFEFSVDLPPGDYTVRAYAESAEDGSLFAEDTVDISVE